MIMETMVLKQQYLQVMEHSNPTTLVLEDKNEEINDTMKQKTYNHKTFKRFPRSSTKKKILVVTLLNYEFGNTSGENNKRGWFLILQENNIVLKLSCYD
jgi:hypothetical protein